MNAIKVDHLTKIYRQQQKQPGFTAALRSLFQDDAVYRTAVNDVSFTVKEGDIVGLLGSNGAGKTTILKILSGVLYPTKGCAEVAGDIPYLRSNDFKKKIALVVGQKNQMIWDLPAMDTLLWLKEIYDIEKGKFADTVKKLTHIFQAEDLLHLQVRRMSLGQRMKMELIASMIHNPEVVFLDEPTIGLDIVIQNNFRNFIREYNKQTGATIILTSHNLLDVEALCEKVILINDGKITYNDALANLIHIYCDHKVITLQGMSKKIRDMDLLQGMNVLSEDDDGTVKIKVKRDICQNAIKYIWSNLIFNDFSVEDISINEIIQKALTDKD